MANPRCSIVYNFNMFTILDTANTNIQLPVKELLYITKYQPILCKKKELSNLLLSNFADYIATNTY